VNAREVFRDLQAAMVDRASLWPRAATSELGKFLHQAHVTFGPAPMLFAKCYSAQVGRGLSLRQLCILFRHYKPVR
jgi:hypothetical protein